MKYAKTIGFEFEFGCKIGASLPRNIKMGDYKKDIANWHGLEWFEVPAGFRSAEVQSSPVYLSHGKKLFRKFLHQLKNREKFYTGSGSGMHINIGFDDPLITRRVNKLDLACLFNDIKWLGAFGRQYNETCAPLLVELKDNDGDAYPSEFARDFIYELKRAKSVKQLKEKFKGSKNDDDDDRYQSINFSNLWSDGEYETYEEELVDGLLNPNNFSHENKPYFEIRIAGNRDYQFRYKEMEMMIDEFCLALDRCVEGKSNSAINNKLRRQLLKFNKPKNTKPWISVPH
jgi:hypothetical protein